MPDVCEFCGQRLWRGKGGNYASCAVCPAKVCRRCQKYWLCPTHFNALSPSSQVALKRASFRQTLLIVTTFSLTLILIFVLFVSEILPIYLFGPVYFGDAAFLGVLFLIKRAWVVGFWKRNAVTFVETPAPAPASWQCETCGFENPSQTHTCGKCGRDKSTSLRIA
jgi:hypothetical protein